VRLVCAPVSEQTANLRRMKARNETHGRNPSKTLLELLSWTILITTIPGKRADFKKLLAIYSLRWRVEILFKAWKSHMKFAALHRVSKSLMLILLQARLLLITCCTNILYRALKSLSADIEQSDGFHKTLLRYCYDQRKRQNFSEKWSSLA
jgi:IS4 transposase